MTERNVAHRRKNPVDDQVLELLLTGESGTIDEGLGRRGRASSPTNGHRRSTGTRRRDGSPRAPGALFFRVASEFSSTVARNLTLLGNGSRLYHSSRKPKLLIPDVDESWATILTNAGLVRAMVEIVGVAEQAFVPLPVVLGAERIVNSDEAAAGPNVLAQRRLGPIQVRIGRRVDSRCRVDTAVPCAHSVSRLVLRKITAL